MKNKIAHTEFHEKKNIINEPLFYFLWQIKKETM